MNTEQLAGKHEAERIAKRDADNAAFAKAIVDALVARGFVKKKRDPSKFGFL